MPDPLSKPTQSDEYEGVPQHILDAGKAADELALNQGKDPSTVTPQETPEIPAPQQPVLPDPSIVVEDIPPVAPDPNAPAPEPSPSPKPVDFKHKYDVLQGKYNAEVPILHDENKRLRAELAASRVQPVPVPAAPNIVPAPAPEPKLIDTLLQNPKFEYLKTEFPDVVTLMSQVADEMEKRVSDKIGQVSTKVDTVVQKTARSESDKFYDTLDTAVKDWETIQRSPEFLAWASQPDRYTGIPKGNLLKSAADSFDSIRTINIFEDFVKETSSPVPSPSPTPSPAPIPNPGPVTAPQRPIVAPPRSSGSPIPRVDVNLQPEIIKASDIQKFYQAMQRDKFQGTSEEARALQVKYDKAIAERRVDPDS